MYEFLRLTERLKPVADAGGELPRGWFRLNAEICGRFSDF